MTAGTRYICLTGMDVEMLVKTVTRVNYDLMIELGEHFKKILGEAEQFADFEAFTAVPPDGSGQGEDQP